MPPPPVGAGAARPAARPGVRRHTTPSASAAAMARTRHSVSGATVSQQAGTALATMAGWKLEKAAATGPGRHGRAGRPGRRSNPTRSRAAGLAQRPTRRCEVGDGVNGFDGDPEVAGGGAAPRWVQRLTCRAPVGELSGWRMPPLLNGSMSMRTGTGSGSSSSRSSSGRAPRAPSSTHPRGSTARSPRACAARSRARPASRGRSVSDQPADDGDDEEGEPEEPEHHVQRNMEVVGQDVGRAGGEQREQHGEEGHAEGRALGSVAGRSSRLCMAGVARVPGSILGHTWRC